MGTEWEQAASGEAWHMTTVVLCLRKVIQYTISGKSISLQVHTSGIVLVARYVLVSGVQPLSHSRYSCTRSTTIPRSMSIISPSHGPPLNNSQSPRFAVDFRRSLSWKYMRGRSIHDFWLASFRISMEFDISSSAVTLVPIDLRSSQLMCLLITEPLSFQRIIALFNEGSFTASRYRALLH